MHQINRYLNVLKIDLSILFIGWQNSTPRFVLLPKLRNKNLKTNQISFGLYYAHSRVGRENLVLRHLIVHFPPISGSGGTQRRVLPGHQSEEMEMYI